MRGWFVWGVLGILVLPGVVWGQSPLEELERRLESGRMAPREPGYLGLTADSTVTGRGLRVVAVRPGGPADEAGLRVGDVLLELERRPLRTLDDLGDILKFRAAGQSVALTFERGGERHVVSVRLAGRPELSREPPMPDGAPAEEVLPPVGEALPAPTALAPGKATRDEIESLLRESAELRRRLEAFERRLIELQERIEREEAVRP